MADAVASIDARELKRLAADLRKVAPEVRKQLPKRMRQAAEPIRQEAEARKPASDFRVGVRFKASGRDGATVKIVATSRKRPELPGLLERGNAGSRNPSRFRHPVFGDRDVWVEQATRPFLAPALHDKREEAIRNIAEIVDDVERVLRGGVDG